MLKAQSASMAENGFRVVVMVVVLVFIENNWSFSGYREIKWTDETQTFALILQVFLFQAWIFFVWGKATRCRLLLFSTPPFCFALDHSFDQRLRVA
ncbi:hypothetical protein OPIT5_17810 [Opitutaceae bacterium TAV5]|nr:hypothetical protein OPIT5_17810 [Opitutaceae bacterium TAV5]